MAALATLVVVVVADAGLRTALAAHLSLDGLDLLTASGIGYGLLDRPIIRKPAILVIDEALIPGDADLWIATQQSLDSWRHLVVLTAAAPGPVDGGDWLARVSQRNGRKPLSDLLAVWARDESE